MALVLIARFADLTEAQAAAAALRASDIPVMVQNEFHGQAVFFMQQALGGFRLWVPEEDAAERPRVPGAMPRRVRPPGFRAA
jgi:hypothetical protein